MYKESRLKYKNISHVILLDFINQQVNIIYRLILKLDNFSSANFMLQNIVISDTRQESKYE